MRHDLFGTTMLVLVIVMTVALFTTGIKGDDARARTRGLCLDVVAGLERELLRPDVDSTEAGLVLGATWQTVRNCALTLDADAPFLDALYSGEPYRRRAALERIREKVETGW